MIGPLSFRATEYLNALRHRKEDVPRYRSAIAAISSPHGGVHAAVRDHGQAVSNQTGMTSPLFWAGWPSLVQYEIL